MPSKAFVALGSTRLLLSNEVEFFMMGLNQEIDQIWIAIGPEGGWTKDEHLFARKKGCISVQFGESILRTSTAAVVATQLMVDWRRNCSSYVQ